MYTPQARTRHFTHFLRVEAIPRRFQELLHEWSRHLPRGERLEYTDGEFYMVVPFEMLSADTIGLSELLIFSRRLQRRERVGKYKAIEQHIAIYPFKQWRRYGEPLDTYIEMMFLLHHLKANIPTELGMPSTLAIFFHD